MAAESSPNLTAKAKRGRPLGPAQPRDHIAPVLPPPAVFDTVQAAAYVKLSTQFLEIARTRGSGPPYLKFSRAVRYRPQDLDEWLASRVVKSTAEAVQR